MARCLERLQFSIFILVVLFEHTGLLTNTTKTKGMTCVSGRIRIHLSEDMVHKSRMGMAARDEWIYRRVQYDLYN